MSTQPPCETSEDEEVECWTCEDEGFYVTVGGTKMPCPDCKLGDANFYHEADLSWQQRLRDAVHVDDYLPDVDPEYDG